MNRFFRLSIRMILVLGGVFLVSLNNEKAFALTYSQDIGVNFTFRSALQLSLSSADLIIRNLAPGTSADSNIITVNIKTNSTAGYTLNATVGNETTYDTRNLVHSTSQQAAPFTSVDFGSSIATNANLDPNKWAYSYSTNAGSTWANYSGLPKYDDETNIATLKTTTGPVESANGDNVEFKIAAKAADTQLAGVYNNVINFTLVAKPLPKTLEMAFEDAGKEKYNGFYKMQDMSSEICADAEIIGEDSQMRAVDIRDNKVYWITKLTDNKCWMTQNLDLNLDSSKTYTHADTDLGYGDNSTTEWTPSTSTQINKPNVWEWANSTVHPESYDPGDIIWQTANNFNPFDEFPNQEMTLHYHIGNSYNWTAAVALNDSSSYTDESLAVTQSICPANWRLPSYSPTNDYENIVVLYGGQYSGSYTFQEPNTPYLAPLYFLPGGTYWGGGGTPGNFEMFGYYWFPNADDATFSHSFEVNKNNREVRLYDTRNRGQGVSVRCVAR